MSCCCAGFMDEWLYGKEMFGIWGVGDPFTTHPRPLSAAQRGGIIWN